MSVVKSLPTILATVVVARGCWVIVPAQQGGGIVDEVEEDELGSDLVRVEVVIVDEEGTGTVRVTTYAFVIVNGDIEIDAVPDGG